MDTPDPVRRGDGNYRDAAAQRPDISILHDPADYPDHRGGAAMRFAFRPFRRLTRIERRLQKVRCWLDENGLVLGLFLAAMALNVFWYRWGVMP